MCNTGIIYYDTKFVWLQNQYGGGGGGGGGGEGGGGKQKVFHRF